MPIYNLTGIVQNSTGILSFTQGVNEVLMGNALGTLFLIGIVVVIYISYTYTTGDSQRAFGGASFIGFILSVLLKGMSLVPDTTVYVALAMWAGFIAFTWKR